MFKKNWTLLGLSLALTSQLFTQTIGETISNGELHGNFQIDAQYYNEDSIIGAQAVPEQLLSNGFANFIYTNKNIQAGFRYESYLNPMLGFPTGYKGSGIPYRYVTFTNDQLEVTAGNFYDQFGSGLIFRSYEARGLGYDNVMDGFRVKFRPVKGVYLKALIGRQRLFFDLGEGIVRGLDGEVFLNDVINKLQNNATKITIGASFVSKYQPDQNTQYVLPENVASYDLRTNIQHKKINFNIEYAYKYNDPSADNNFIYKPGEALLTQISYSKKGLGISVSGLRVDNMSYRSDRNQGLTNLLINYIPAFTRQHTYNLLATLYPFATQPLGEIGGQAEMVFKIKKGSLLGGKHGTKVLLNYSTYYNIDTVGLNDLNTNRLGYKTNYFSFGDEKYWEEMNIEVSKKFSKNLKGIFTYSNIVFNQDILQGKPGNPIIYANIGVIDLTWKIAKKHAIRTELQGLFTHQDHGSWATGLIEYTYSPHWFVALMDQYNYGAHEGEAKVHYYYGSFGYIKNANRIQIGYGRQRAGIFCVGGVCRNVPAANGVTISITSSF
jgi:hypothetical protein